MSGETDESDLDRWIYHDFDLPHITAAAVAEALDGFALSLCAAKDVEWLAMAVRRSLGATLRHVSDRPDRQTNADTRKELERLSKRAGKLWLALFEGRSDAAESAIWDYSWPRGEPKAENGDGTAFIDPVLHRRFNAAVGELSWLSGFLLDVARDIPSQRPRWTEAEWREIRIERGQCLVPVFEAAFMPNRLMVTTFGDFYQRMVALAFGEGDIPDFEALIAEVRQRHLSVPFIPDPDFIPGI